MAGDIESKVGKMNRTVYYPRAVQVFEFMIEELLRQVISEFDMLHGDPELRAVIPRYLGAVAALCDSTIRSTDAFIAANWRDYFALSEPPTVATCSQVWLPLAPRRYPDEPECLRRCS